MDLKPTAIQNFTISLIIFVFFCSLLIFPPFAKAQTDDTETLKTQAALFLKQNNYLAALPVLEKLAAVEPDNANIQFFLGFCLVTKSIDTKDAATQKQLRLRARSALVKAKELGRNDQLVNSLIDSITPDGNEAAASTGGAKPKYSTNEQANSLMEQGEAAFYRGNGDEALKLYQKALEVDPKLYRAALYCGDVYGQKGDYSNAETWYQKAIAIDPNIETAYRYSATPLMKAGKYDEARDRYVEAFITDPFSRLAAGGLQQWASVTKRSLGHPKIDIPTTVEKGANGNTTITLGMNDKDDDGSSAWTTYGISRASWQLEDAGKPGADFRKAYPNEKTYRHSLAEEIAALKTVVTLVKSNKKIKTLNPSLAKIVELHDKGLLEPYVLLARMDRGIAQDYRAYLQSNRAKLRQYVLEYVIDGDKK